MSARNAILILTAIVILGVFFVYFLINIAKEPVSGPELPAESINIPKAKDIKPPQAEKEEIPSSFEVYRQEIEQEKAKNAETRRLLGLPPEGGEAN